MIHTSYSSFAMAGGESWGLVVVGRSLGYQTDGSTATELLSQMRAWRWRDAALLGVWPRLA